MVPYKWQKYPYYPAITACIFKYLDKVEAEVMFPQELKRVVLSRNPNTGIYFYKKTENGYELNIVFFSLTDWLGDFQIIRERENLC